MKHIFDSKTNTTATIDGVLGYDEVHGEHFFVTPLDEERFVEITEISCKILTKNLKRFLSTDEEFALELSGPILQIINDELKKYGV